MGNPLHIGDAAHIVVLTGYGHDVINGAIVALGPAHAILKDRSLGVLHAIELGKCTVLPGHVFQRADQTRADMVAHECLKTREWQPDGKKAGDG